MPGSDVLQETWLRGSGVDLGAVENARACPERAVFGLREVFDLDYEEIAEAVGKTPAAVRQIAHRFLGDGGGGAQAALAPVIGADAVAAGLANLATRSLQLAQVNGYPALIL